MRITKGQHLHIVHTHKGEFDAVATRDFDTNNVVFYPVALAKGSGVTGLSVATYWEEGDAIPCRGSLSKLTIIE